MTSFEVIDRVLKVLSNRQRYPLLEEVILIGHSKGGRFVQRYGAVNRALLEFAPAVSCQLLSWFQ